MNHPAIGIVLILTAACFSSLELLEAAEPQNTPLSSSPDGFFSLRRTKEESGDLGGVRKRVEICDRSGVVLYSWVSPIGPTTPYWSPDSRYLAVNDSPSVGGDSLRVFSLDKQRSEARCIREPDQKKLLGDIGLRHGFFFSAVERATLQAQEWRGERLWCEVSGNFSSKRQKDIMVPFHYLWVFQVKGQDYLELVEEWTKTAPSEVLRKR